ncbi:MAG: amidohydrolase [Acidimicrobiia bacterium]|nr:amidohydrolase [Acidimicrobiia bacterium]
MGERRLLVADRLHMVPGSPHDNAVLVDDGQVVATGVATELRGSGVEELTFPGATLLPGLRDAHLHPVPYAALLSGVSLKSARDIAELATRLRAAAEATSQPIVAMRLDDETLAERRLPTRLDLDDAVGDRPTLVHRYCGHVAVANSAALALAGIDGSTPDPDGGIIDRDPAGVPTGVLRETAIEIASRAMAGSSPVTPSQLLHALRALTALGLTSIGAMVRVGDGPWSSLGNEAELIALAAEELPLRVHGYVIANTVDELIAGRASLSGRSPRLRWAGLKRFADGSFGGHTAAMLEPYADAADEMGTLRLSGVDATLGRACLDMGGTVAIHAIGDRACREVIDLFEELGAPAGRARIEHVSVITQDDMLRMASLGIVGCVQPAFLGSEADWLEHRVGPGRIASTYAFAAMTDAGVLLAAGSDCPVEPPDPWAGIALARDRAGVVPDQGLDAEASLALFTSGGAAALGEPMPLAVGSPADVIVVDRDPVAATATEVRHTRVHHVFVGGEEIAVDPTLPNWVD